jgi:hypothetical protein
LKCTHRTISDLITYFAANLQQICELPKMFNGPRPGGTLQSGDSCNDPFLITVTSGLLTAPRCVPRMRDCAHHKLCDDRTSQRELPQVLSNTLLFDSLTVVSTLFLTVRLGVPACPCQYHLQRCVRNYQCGEDGEVVECGCSLMLHSISITFLRLDISSRVKSSRG